MEFHIVLVKYMYIKCFYLGYFLLYDGLFVAICQNSATARSDRFSRTITPIQRFKCEVFFINDRISG